MFSLGFVDRGETRAQTSRINHQPRFQVFQKFQPLSKPSVPPAKLFPRRTCGTGLLLNTLLLLRIICALYHDVQ